MNISLTKELKEFVTGKVASGRYTSPSEVVRDALRLLERQEGFEPMSVEAALLETAGKEASPMSDVDWTRLRRRTMDRAKIQ